MKRLFTVGIVLLFYISFTTVGYADNSQEIIKEDKVEVNIKGGGFDLTTAPLNEFGEITIEIDDVKYSNGFQGPFIVKDLRGINENWQLTVSAAPLRNVTRNLEFPNVLSISPLSKIERQGNATLKTLPEIVKFNESILDDGDVLIAQSKNGSGAGQFSLTFPDNAIHIAVSPEMKQGKYELKLDWKLQTVP